MKKDDFDPRNYTPEQLNLIEQALLLIVNPPNPKIEIIPRESDVS